MPKLDPNAPARDEIEELARFAEAHHGDQPLNVILHGLTVDIPDRLRDVIAADFDALKARIAELKALLKWRTEKAQALLDNVEFSAREAFCPVGDEFEFHAAWKIEATSEFEAWGQLKAALASVQCAKKEVSA